MWWQMGTLHNTVRCAHRAQYLVPYCFFHLSMTSLKTDLLNCSSLCIYYEIWCL